MRTTIFTLLLFTSSFAFAQTLTGSHYAEDGGQHWRTTILTDGVKIEFINFSAGKITSKPKVVIVGRIEQTGNNTFPYMLSCAEHGNIYFDNNGLPYHIDGGAITLTDKLF